MQDFLKVFRVRSRFWSCFIMTWTVLITGAIKCSHKFFWHEWKKNDSEYVFYLSDIIIPNTQVLRGFMSFDQWCLCKVKKVSQLVNFIFRIFWKSSEKSLSRLWKCRVLPLLDYTFQIYFPSSWRRKKVRLLKVSKKCLRNASVA